MLNISWEVEDEYGDYITKTVNLTATSPTSVQDIGVYENLEFTFLWDELNIEASNDYVEVTCMITIDPFDNIYETRDDDNSGTFEILIKHIPKPTKKKGGGGMPGFDSVLMISAIALVLFGLMITSRRRRR